MPRFTYDMTEDDHVAMQEMRNRGADIQIIAAEFACSTDYVVRHTKASPFKKPFDGPKAQALRDAGWPLAKIADEMRCTVEKIEEATKENLAVKPKKPLEGIFTR